MTYEFGTDEIVTGLREEVAIREHPMKRSTELSCKAFGASS